MSEKLIRISPRIPQKLLKEFKADCKSQGRTLEGGVMFLIRTYMEAARKTA